jgi:hypothetical protein
MMDQGFGRREWSSRSAPCTRSAKCDRSSARPSRRRPRDPPALMNGLKRRPSKKKTPREMRVAGAF